MKNLRYFEKKADELIAGNWDYRLMKKADIILSLMKEYRKENNISWNEYKPVYDKFFCKYH